MDKNNIYNADNPARRKAIKILQLIDRRLNLKLNGSPYYMLEDEITEIIIVND